jgi:hypothetical protein
MARGDIQIDTEVNDLRIEKVNSNPYITSSWSYVDVLNYVEIEVLVPFQYADGIDSTLDWRTLVATTRSLGEIDDSYDALQVLVSYRYIDTNGLKQTITTLQLAHEPEGDTIRYLTVQLFNELVVDAGKQKDFLYNYRKDADTSHEYFILNTLVLGDFVVENSVNQNEYILLNANEGSFLQNPTFGVGAGNYIQAPTNDETFLQTIVDKFAQDALRVLGIQKSEEVIEVQSEDFNRE